MFLYDLVERLYMEEIKNNNEIALKQSDKKKNTRNTTLNFFEFMAACLIVFIHAKFPGVIGTLVEGLGRFGVPLFFVVSGFYLIKPGMTKDELRKKLKTRIIRVSKLLIFSFGIYFILSFAQGVFGSHSTGVVNWVKTTFTFNKFIKLIVFNLPFFSPPNWFVLALIYSYVVIYLFGDVFLKSNRIKYFFVLVMLVCIFLRLTINLIGASIFGVELSEGYFYRNWFVTGLPFISLGMLLKQNEDRINNISTNLIITILVISFIAMPLENYIHSLFDDILMDTYLGNILCVFAIIALSIKKPNLFSKSKFINQKGNYTMFIYIFHQGVIIVLLTVLGRLGLSGSVLKWLEPLMVLAISVALAMVFNKILCFIKDRRHNKK